MECDPLRRSTIHNPCVSRQGQRQRKSWQRMPTEIRQSVESFHSRGPLQSHRSGPVGSGGQNALMIVDALRGKLSRRPKPALIGKRSVLLAFCH